MEQLLLLELVSSVILKGSAFILPLLYSRLPLMVIAGGFLTSCCYPIFDYDFSGLDYEVSISEKGPIWEEFSSLNLFTLVG